ncbi:MAG TPA: mevalonate kinase [Thermoplasmata archaeon]|nr:mevalonate kinase [Thermoplasmata archaeon]
MSAPSDDVPNARLPLSASAPGKCILFGEHAVVHGGPEVLFALDLRTQVVFRSAESASLNGAALAAAKNPYVTEALRALPPPGPAVALTSVSRVPRAAGLGSSAALVAALAAGLSALRGGVDRPSLAQRAFQIERGAQGVGSPGDTSAAVAGGFLALNTARGTPLWEVTDGDRSWTVRRIPDPNWTWIVADTRVPRGTGSAVRQVAERLARPDGPDLLERFRAVAEAGLDALEAEDRDRTGVRLTENQALLRELGVSHPRIEALLEVARSTCTGAKLTGAGLGGSIVALPRPGTEIATAQRLRQAGGDVYVVRPTGDGARLL